MQKRHYSKKIFVKKQIKRASSFTQYRDGFGVESLKGSMECRCMSANSFLNKAVFDVNPKDVSRHKHALRVSEGKVIDKKSMKQHFIMEIMLFNLIQRK